MNDKPQNPHQDTTDDKSEIIVVDHIKIVDEDSGEIIVDQRG